MAECFRKRRESGKEQGVRVPNSEDVASCTGLESCAVCREAQGEASTEVRIGLA